MDLLDLQKGLAMFHSFTDAPHLTRLRSVAFPTTFHRPDWGKDELT